MDFAVLLNSIGVACSLARSLARSWLHISVHQSTSILMSVNIITDPSLEHDLLHLIHQRIKLLPFILMPFSLKQHGDGTTALLKSTFDLWMMNLATSHMTWDQERLNGN